jgi:hypothetical protein
MNRALALSYVARGVDDAAHDYDASAARAQAGFAHARLVGWQCGFEPMFIAVWSYTPGVRLNDDEAIDLAVDLLTERRWFAGEATQPDWVL